MLVQLTYEEGTALRLTASERHLALALTARCRWFNSALGTRKLNEIKSLSRRYAVLSGSVNHILEFERVRCIPEMLGREAGVYLPGDFDVAVTKELTNFLHINSILCHVHGS